LDGRVGHKNPVVTPQVPTRGLIWQAILDDEAYGQGNDAVGVMGLGQGIVGHVRVEILATAGTAMLGKNELNVTRPTGNQVPNVMECSLASAIAETGLATNGARPMREIAAAKNDLRFRQIFGPRDALRDVWQILAWTRHSDALLGQLV
jgi:hypothetical protein